MKFGIDLSEFQPSVQYEKCVKSGVEWVIIRAGYGREENQKDSCFDKHYNGFKDLVPVGAYQYSYAKDADGARKEAAVMLKWCKGKKLEIPLFLDLEESSVFNTGKANVMSIAKAWCEAIKAAGYRAGIYANTNWFNHVLEKSAFDYVWVADWGNTQPVCDVWQFGGGTVNYKRDRHVEGVGICDQNYMVKNVISKANDEVKKDDDEIKKEVRNCVVTLIYLQNGSTGREVKSLQILLNGYGFNCGTADGIFGPKTEAAVRAFQKGRCGVDGIVGPTTWGKLLRG